MLQGLTKRYSLPFISALSHLLREEPVKRADFAWLMAAVKEPSSVSLSRMSTPKSTVKGKMVEFDTNSGGTKKESFRQLSH